jgi:hypothetical protein
MDNCVLFAGYYAWGILFRLAGGAAIFDLVTMFFGHRRNENVLKINHHGPHFQDVLRADRYASTTTVTSVGVYADEIFS